MKTLKRFDKVLIDGKQEAIVAGSSKANAPEIRLGLQLIECAYLSRGRERHSYFLRKRLTPV